MSTDIRDNVTNQEQGINELVFFGSSNSHSNCFTSSSLPCPLPVDIKMFSEIDQRQVVGEDIVCN